MTQENTSLETPTVGRVLHFVVENSRGEVKCRPATVTEDWGGKMVVNLCVYPDGSNDGQYGTDDHRHYHSNEHTESANVPLMTRWEPSVPGNNEIKQVRTWHWPRLCRNLLEAETPYIDLSGRRLYHSHPEGLEDLFNCTACITRQSDRVTTARNKD